MTAGPDSLGDLRARREALLAPSLSLSYRDPLQIVAGEGAYLIDESGRRYLDLVNNVCHVGHCHPHVVSAATDQMVLLNTNTRYLHRTVLDLAQRLVDALPGSLEVCFFVNSGSEANDLALRLARAATGRRGVVAVEGGYHGNLSSLIEVSHYKFSGPGGEGAPPHVAAIPMPDIFRGRYRADQPGVGERYAEHVSESAEALTQRGEAPGAFICEPILGCGGQIVPPENFLRRAFERSRDAGMVTIADEVQIGFGRVGDRFWGFELDSAVPDIVTLGKPFGNGHPLGAVVTTRAVARAFDNGMEYFNTFGGNPVSCAIGTAVLEVIEREALQAQASRVGGVFLKALGELSERHPVVGDVRGRGLFLGVELVEQGDSLTPAPGRATDTVEAMKLRGFLLSTDGPDHNVLKFKPPMVIEEAEALSVVAALDEVLTQGG